MSRSSTTALQEKCIASSGSTSIKSGTWSRMGRFTGAFFVSEITRNEFFPNGQPGVGGENHVGQFRLRFYEMNFAIEFRQRGMQIFPLLLRDRGVRAAGAAHPGINLVLDAVIV